MIFKNEWCGPYTVGFYDRALLEISTTGSIFLNWLRCVIKILFRIRVPKSWCKKGKGDTSWIHMSRQRQEQHQQLERLQIDHAASCY